MDEVVVVAGAYPLELERSRVVDLPRLGARAGSVAALRALRARRATSRRPWSCLADGPNLAPAAVGRVLDAWRARRGATRRRELRRRPRPSDRRRPRALGLRAGRGPARLRAAARPLRRPRPARRRGHARGPAVRRRLLRPAVLIPAFVVLSLGAGIAYAAWTQLDSGRVDANMEILDALPLYPGAHEIQRITQTTNGEDVVPVPDEIVTSALYAPPAGRGAGGRDRLLRRAPPAGVEAADEGRQGERRGRGRGRCRPRSGSTSRATTTASACSPTAWRRGTRGARRSPSRPQAGGGPCPEADEELAEDFRQARPRGSTADETGRAEEPPAEH